MKISVTGCGYLGAVHATCMAFLGHEVIAIDTVPEKVKQLNDGIAPFYEPGFSGLLMSTLTTGRLRFTDNVADAKDATVHFLAVGTPQVQGSNRADLSYLDAALDSLTPYLKPGDIVVGKSTVPVGTAERLQERLTRDSPGVNLIWNPEFLREGHAVADTVAPDRLVYGVPVGGEHSVCILDEAYAPILATGVERLITNHATAELVKVAANAFLATKISFINAFSDLCTASGGDIGMLADAIGLDDRIGRKFLNAGAGFGGGCLPKDIRALHARSVELGVGESFEFLRHVDNINLSRRTRIVDKIRAAAGGDLSNVGVAILGLSFKPDSDDIRDSPGLDVARFLIEEGAQVTAHDPQAGRSAKRTLPNLIIRDTPEATVAKSLVTVVMTEWDQYRELNPANLLTHAGHSPSIIDARNCLDHTAWRESGWQVDSMGRV